MSASSCKYDCLLIGGGVIGLSIALRLADEGLRVGICECGQPGRQASWAGAGIIPPGGEQAGASPLDRLIAASSKLHPHWSHRLRSETGIDNGYCRCGGIYIAPGSDSTSALSAHEIQNVEPALTGITTCGYLLPDEAQIRNPRHLKALIAACQLRGVEILCESAVTQLRYRNNQVVAVRTNKQEISAGEYCIAAGCWSSKLIRWKDSGAVVRPVRGQMLLLKGDRPLLTHIVNSGLRYIVPRADGHVLVGSTMEDAGFECRNTVAGVKGLQEFAFSLVPKLAHIALVRKWAGLRPATWDGIPMLGRIQPFENLSIATGHFRNGLTLAPITAEVMSAVIRRQQTAIDVSAFDPRRSMVEPLVAPTPLRPPLAMLDA